MILEMASMTRDQVANVADEALAVFPTASMEQHGPHLPICTDTVLALEVIDRALKKVRPPRPIVVLPPLHFGSSHHHLSYAGVLSLTSDHVHARGAGHLRRTHHPGFSPYPDSQRSWWQYRAKCRRSA